jgi:hypothetical protein
MVVLSKTWESRFQEPVIAIKGPKTGQPLAVAMGRDRAVAE